MLLPNNVKDLQQNQTTKSNYSHWYKRPGRRRKSIVFLILFTLCLTAFVWSYSDDETSFLSWSPHKNNGTSNNTTSSNTYNGSIDNTQTISLHETVKAELMSLITAHSLIVFSKTYCPYSKRAKAILNGFTYKIPFYTMEVDLRDDASVVKQVLGDISGRYTFPNIFVNQRSVGGASELEALQGHENQLASLLRSEGIII